VIEKGEITLGIWIRSQNGMVLCNADVIWVDGEKVYAEGEGLRKAFVGEYSSEGEATEVLNQIQEYVIFHERVRLLPSEDWETPKVVFRMPPAGGISGSRRSALDSIY